MTGSLPLALRMWRTYIRPHLAGLFSALVLMLLKQQQFAQAEPEVRKLLAYDGRDAEAHNLLGVALASQGRIGEAGKEFAEAVRLNPQYTEARNNLARTSSAR